MHTLYHTLRGDTPDPLPVELWTYGGQRLGKLGAFESMAFTFTAKPGNADTAELELYLDALTASLLPCDGSVLVAARYNGKTHLTTPVTAEAHNHPDDAATGMLTVNAVGGWSFLEGAVVPPGLAPVVQYATELTYDLEGPLETVITEIINTGIARTGHPLIVAPSTGRGPTVRVTGAWETVGEVVADVLKHTGYRLAFDGWVPTDPQPFDNVTLTRPCYLVSLKPHGRREGLIWSTVAGDVPEWSVQRKRASATRVVVSNGADELGDRILVEVRGDEPASPWAVREIYLEHEPEEDENNDPIRLATDTETAGRRELNANAAALEVSLEVTPSAGWEFGTDEATPRQFDVGDTATVDLPVLGEFTQLVTDVEVKLTPQALTVTPTVGTPDTLDLGVYGSTAELNKRLTRLERKRG